MKISLMDRSLYYKGLLLLVRKDREIHEQEKRMMLGIGKMLGFDARFCTRSIEKILVNPYIVDEPPVFSQKDIALCFIRDGLLLAVSDGQISGAETAWLQSVAEKNGLAGAWAAELAKIPPGAKDLPLDALELKKFVWE